MRMRDEGRMEMKRCSSREIRGSKIHYRRMKERERNDKRKDKRKYQRKENWEGAEGTRGIK
jgi:hypothetical protein